MKSRLFPRYRESFSLEDSPEGKEFLALTEELLASPEVQRLEEIVHHYSVSRLQHAKSVAYLSYLRCREKGLRAEETARAALLHDLFYRHRKEKVREKYMLFRHPALALENARKLLSLSHIGEDIILRHMWPFGALPRTREGRLVSYIDKYCAMHEFLASRFPSLYRKRMQRKESAL
jgi:uncharacterized protein